MKEHDTLTYTEEDIQVLEGLIAVRKRPGMYIGSTGSRGLHHLLWEIVDNAKDETLAGYNDKIIVTLEKDGSVRVEDHGRGIPTGMHKSGRPVPEVIFTTLHAGGKFGGGGYKKSGGLHGVGSSVVVALSKWLEVEIHRDGLIHKQRFEYVVDEHGNEHVGKPVTGLEVIGKTNRTGTTVTFLPDESIFTTTRFDYEQIRDRFRETAFLLKKLRMVLIDNRGPETRREEFYFEDGLKSYVEYLNEGKQTLHPVVYFDGEKDDVYVELAFQYNDGYTETLVSYVNSIPTTDGGTHVTGFRNATTRIFNEFARRKGYLKEKDANLTGNVRIANQGQAGERRSAADRGADHFGEAGLFPRGKSGSGQAVDRKSNQIRRDPGRAAQATGSAARRQEREGREKTEIDLGEVCPSAVQRSQTK
jgi:topoisomerase-4 subunit B